MNKKYYSGAQVFDIISKCNDKVFLELLNRFAEEPGADVVEVVRCKDCWKRGDEDFCPLVSDSCYPPALPDDWFCKDGERREDVDFTMK